MRESRKIFLWLQYIESELGSENSIAASPKVKASRLLFVLYLQHLRLKMKISPAMLPIACRLSESLLRRNWPRILGIASWGKEFMQIRSLGHGTLKR